MERLEYIGNKFAELITNMEVLPEFQMEGNTKDERLITMILGLDKRANKCLLLDSYNRDMDNNELLNLIINMLSCVCNQRDDEGKHTESSKNLFDAIVNLISSWAAISDTNENALKTCIEYYKKMKEEKLEESESKA